MKIPADLDYQIDFATVGDTFWLCNDTSHANISFEKVRRVDCALFCRRTFFECYENRDGCITGGAANLLQHKQLYLYKDPKEHNQKG